jgi:transcriptional regulator with XRE-family HTH domain
MTSRHSPTVRGRRLGLELRRLRQAANLTIEAVADEMACSISKISRIETGHTGVTPRDVRRMLNLYDVDGDRAEDLVQVAREAKQKGWWHLYGQVLTGAYVGLEASARSIRGYESQTLPGLFQTERYAREMIRAARHDIDSDEIERRVHVRMARQSLLNQEDPVRIWVVQDEAALCRVVGGTIVMREQFDHLCNLAERPTVTLQVLPFSAGAHAGMDGAFAILGYDTSPQEDLVFATNAAGGLFLEKPEELHRYGLIFDHLRAKALEPEESIAFLADRAKEL